MSHPLFARAFDRVFGPAMEREVAPLRQELLAGLHGRALEVRAGNGLSFAHYPPSVSEVVALEPEPYLRARAELAATAAPVALTVREGLAETLPFETVSFDAAVASIVLCSLAIRHVRYPSFAACQVLRSELRTSPPLRARTCSSRASNALGRGRTQTEAAAPSP